MIVSWWDHFYDRAMLSKRNLILLICFSVVSYCSFSFYMDMERPFQRQPNVEVHPVYWLTDSQLVLMAQNDVLVRDYGIEDVSNERVIFAMPDPFRKTSRFPGGGCFSETNWHLRWWETKGSGRSMDRSYYEIKLIDGEVVDSQKHGTLDTQFVVNPFDCTVVPHGQQTGTTASIRPKGLPVELRGTRRHFSESDVSNVGIGLDLRHTVIQYENSNGLQRLDLEPPPTGRKRRLDHTIRDRSSPNYLLYEQDGGIDAGHPDLWSDVAWLVDLRMNTSNLIHLPKPPWFGDYHEKSGCFSCGCECYRDLNLYLVANKIYGHVWGRGFPKWAQGIYEFRVDAELPAWTPVVQGVIANGITFSPNGCRLAYADPDVKVLELC